MSSERNRPIPQLLQSNATSSSNATAIETELSEMWSEVLGEDAVGRNGDCFLGVDSLSVGRVDVRVNARLGVHPGIRQLFDSLLLRDQAETLLERMLQEREDA